MKLLIKRRGVFLFTSIFFTIVFFQNCSQSNFETSSPSLLRPETAGKNDQFLPGEDIANSDENITNLVSTTTTSKKVYYVSTSGNNSNPGTSSLPFRNIAYATWLS